MGRTGNEMIKIIGLYKHDPKTNLLTEDVASPDSKPIIVIGILKSLTQHNIDDEYYARISNNSNWSKDWVALHTDRENWRLCAASCHPQLADLISEEELNEALIRWAEEFK